MYYVIREPFFFSVSEVRRRSSNVQNRKLKALKSGSFSVNIESATSAGSSVEISSNSNVSTAVKGSAATPSAGELNCQSIDINVIQPTPNISPSASLRSFDGENATDIVDSADSAVEVQLTSAVATADSNTAVTVALVNKQPTATLPSPIASPGMVGSNPSPTSTNSGKNTRRVSFSEEEVTSICSDPAGEVTPTASKQRRGSRGGSLATSLRQMTVPMAANATMSYLQVNFSSFPDFNSPVDLVTLHLIPKWYF